MPWNTYSSFLTKPRALQGGCWNSLCFIATSTQTTSTLSGRSCFLISSMYNKCQHQLWSNTIMADIDRGNEWHWSWLQSNYLVGNPDFLCGCSLTYKTHSDKVKPLIPTALSTWLLFGHVLFSSISLGYGTFWGQVDALSPCLSLSSGCAREVLVAWQHKMSCSGTNVFGVCLIWRVVGPMVCINTSTWSSTAQYCTVVKWTVLSGWRSNEKNICIKHGQPLHAVG